MQLQPNAFQLVGRGPAAHLGKPDSGHTGTISLMIRVRRASWNAMKPRIQCVLTQWIPGFSAPAGVRQASGSGPIVMINIR
jgi:hypothetical protein